MFNLPYRQGAREGCRKGCWDVSSGGSGFNITPGSGSGSGRRALFQAGYPIVQDGGCLRPCYFIVTVKKSFYYYLEFVLGAEGDDLVVVVVSDEDVATGVDGYHGLPFWSGDAFRPVRCLF